MAAMVASPRKEDAPGFEQTWDESDAAFLDPASMPISRVPRGWDRKQDVKTVGNGKKKEIWRRYTTRSRTSEATKNEDPDNDSRARPVKRLQRISPKAIEKSAGSRFGRTRAFKATRWDRRKSVLPRKKTTGPEVAGDPSEAVDQEEIETTTTDLGNESFSEVDMDHVKEQPQEMALLPETEDRRATFTFMFQEEEEVPTQGAGNENPTSAFDATPAQLDHEAKDATITRLFQSPIKALTEQTASEPAAYPDLPVSPESEEEAVTAMEQDHPIGKIAAVNVDEDPSSPKRTSNAMELDAVIDPAQQIQVGDDEILSIPGDVEDCEQAEVTSPQEAKDDSTDIDFDEEDNSQDEEFTEASLQLDIQIAMQTDTAAPALEDPNSLVSEDGTVESELPIADSLSSTAEKTMDDITSGLTLELPTSSREPTPRKLRSPSPPPRTETGPEDTTVTFAIDDDTALLKDFLSRAAASKANKAEMISRRESLQNRRDSDVVRHALASPRKALEDKDPNSPSKYDNEATLDLSQTLTLNMNSAAPLSPSKSRAGTEEEEGDDSKDGRISRRSSRARKSRLPAPASASMGPSKIAVKRDGGDPVVLKKTDAQELSLLTRANTRKNKQGAVVVSIRLLKLSNEARNAEDNAIDSTDSIVQVPGKKYVRWDSQLTYFQEDTEATANALADTESLSMPDELSLTAPAAKPSRVRVPRDKNATPRVRKVKNLGSANGTPGKGLLAPAGSLLPDPMLDDKEESKEKQRLPKPKSSRARKMPVASTMDTAPEPGSAAAESKLPQLEIAPVGIDPTKTAAAATKERKSRLATPKKVKLPQLSSSAALGDGKENVKTGIAAQTPKKGIPVPAVIVPPSTVGIETGLPRRRGRRL